MLHRETDSSPKTLVTLRMRLTQSLVRRINLYPHWLCEVPEILYELFSGFFQGVCTPNKRTRRPTSTGDARHRPPLSTILVIIIISSSSSHIVMSPCLELFTVSASYISDFIFLCFAVRLVHANLAGPTTLAAPAPHFTLSNTFIRTLGYCGGSGIGM